ncbi:MAG TPA: hypothetical protein VGI40_12910 [Pirellulaceae bacterium]|jgi:hypothetical protein
MSKRNKQQPVDKSQVAPSQQAGIALHAPAKQPTLLAVSIVLFALWFVFLLVTALFG